MAQVPLAVRLHRLLDPGGQGSTGAGWINRVLAASIVASAIVAVLETEDSVSSRAPLFFLWTERLFGAVFLAEYVARMIAVGEDPRYRGLGGRLRYAASPMALVDLVAVLPLFLGELVGDTQVVRLLRLFRLLRFSRLGPFSRAAAILLTTLRGRLPELLLSLLVALVVLIFSATLMYLIEGADQPAAFGSIPRAMWWAIATLTTVGYGDVYPVTALGRVLAGMTALAAIGLIAAPTGILATAFAEALRQHHAEPGGETAGAKPAE
ncbi:MAG: potassium channel family protein [Alphaproteobacteria bacterium]|nr:potassium channel family protein [Alphaproteobacteria bacterium]